MPTEADPYEPFRVGMRKRHGYCGPYRLGIALGEAGSDLPCPYSNPKSANSFYAGYVVGQEMAAGIPWGTL